MQQSAAEIATELFEENSNALHIEMSRWIITQAQITEPAMYREVVREYRRLQRMHGTRIEGLCEAMRV